MVQVAPFSFMQVKPIGVLQMEDQVSGAFGYGDHASLLALLEHVTSVTCATQQADMLLFPWQTCPVSTLQSTLGTATYKFHASNAPL